jgi:signal transduction histidine kinase
MLSRSPPNRDAQSLAMKDYEETIKGEGPNPVVREILDGIEMGVVLLNKEGKIIFANKASEDILERQRDLLVGKRLLSFFPQGAKEIGVRKGDGKIFFHKKREGAPFKLLIVPYHDAQGRERGRVANLQDMTQIYKMQEEILRIDRLAYLGEFSSTLAHEIRNPLAGIKTTAQALSEEFGENDSRREYIDRIIKEIDRLNDLLRTFFSFAKPRRLDLTPCHLRDVIKEVKGLLAKEAEKMKVTVKEVYDNNLPLVPLDVNQMQQVFMNLFLNALEAMPQGGTLLVEAGRMDSQKGWIQVNIKDTGRGIVSEHLTKIFDPFFTTKSKGLGLGLAITHKILEGHGGSISVESTLGNGSTFILRLPAVADDGD